jgi:hypothetical protein
MMLAEVKRKGRRAEWFFGESAKQRKTAKRNGDQVVEDTRSKEIIRFASE